jgi:UrcA family protein
MYRRAFSALAGFTLASGMMAWSTPVPAAAQTASVAVSTDGLDLNTSEGMGSYDGRVRAAARDACRSRHPKADKAAARCEREFRALALSRAELAMAPSDGARNQ